MFPIPEALSFGERLFLQEGDVVSELLPHDLRCAFGAVQDRLSALTDPDGDGHVEGLGYDTCSGCTSNHMVIGGG